jgi:SAM-dependent methyltransferase
LNFRLQYELQGEFMPDFYNRTRRSSSIGTKLLRSGRVLELPLYWFLRTSDLAREGFENSGSYRFADHIYGDRPSGRLGIGHWLDAQLLRMRAVQAFRARFFNARDELYGFLKARVPEGKPVDVLSVPCGIPRELVEGAQKCRAEGRSLEIVHFHGLDLDREVLQNAVAFAAESDIALTPHQGDALDLATYRGSFDFITSTGFGEFLDDPQLTQFYSTLFRVLRPGGVMVTSGMRRTLVAGYLLDLAELHVHYRKLEDLAAIARAAGFTDTATSNDSSGIQGFLKATK